MVDLTSAVVDSDVPATHTMTDSDGTESVAGSGLLNMFAWDLHAEAIFTRIDTSEENSGSDDESVASSRTGASEVHQHSVSEFEQEVEPQFPTPVIPLGAQALRGGLQSLNKIDLLQVWKVRGNLMKSAPRFVQVPCCEATSFRCSDS